MRHRNGGFKLGRNTSHRRALLRNLVTSIILNDRVHTTITKAKASKPIVEKMITLGKNGSVHARRQALAYMMTPESVDRLFNTVAPRYGSRPGGYSRIVRTGPRQGDASEMAYIELLGAEQELNEKAAKRAEARQKRREEMEKQMTEESAVTEGGDPSAQP
jgi:large subunit ribosomal protein L17